MARFCGQECSSTLPFCSMTREFGHPEATSEDIRRLGEKIRQTREDAGLTMHGAAVLAGVSPTTWGRIEHGSVGVRRTSYAAIEQVLGWEGGSTKIVLEGGDPIPVASGTGRPAMHTSVLEWETALVDEIWAASHLDDAAKEDLTARARTKVAELRAIQDRLRRSAG